MIFPGKAVLFRLSPEGRKALSGLVPARGAVRAWVLGINHLGLGVWVSLGSQRQETSETEAAVLLKWDHFSTAMSEWEPPQVPSSRVRVGFRPV